MTTAKLDLQRHVELVRYSALGHPHRVAANLARLGERTLERYLQRGRDANDLAIARLSELRERRQRAFYRLSDDPIPPPPLGIEVALDAVTTDDQGNRSWTQLALARGDADPPRTRALLALVDDTERTYWRLWRDIKRADASAEAVYLGRIAEAGRGYKFQETRTTERLKDGEVVERTTVTVDKYERAWQANAFLLQARFPEHYGRYRAGQGVVDETDTQPGTDPTGIEDEKELATRKLDELRQRRELKEASGE